LTAALETGAAIPAVAVHSTIKKSTDGRTVQETVDRASLYLAQTPQVFRTDLLVEAYRNRQKQNVTDDAQLLERAGHAVALVEGSPMNIKITTTEDLALAEAIVQTHSAYPGPISNR
jgi:2-C-methyl-D-erythritol 4-phosphate cytidylyltransferase